MGKLKPYIAIVPYYGKLKVNKVLAYNRTDAFKQEETNAPDNVIILTIKEAYQLGRKLINI